MAVRRVFVLRRDKITMTLLLYPKVSDKTQNKFLDPFIFNSIPIALGFIAGYLEEKGEEVKIIDEQLFPLTREILKTEVDRLTAPKIIGISVLTSTYKRAFEIAKTIKEIDAGVWVVLGGIHPTSCPDECLMEPYFDIVVRGEGEETFYELICALRQNRGLESIRGISYKQNGQILSGGDRPLVEDLDSMPPFPYHLFESNRSLYKEFGIIVSSRGCPYRCIFCSSRNISHYNYRSHSLERVINNLDVLINKYNQSHISFLDDNILSDKARFYKIVDFILKNNYQKRASFYICARGRDIDEEFCGRIAPANFELAINFEAGTNRMMKFIRKGETVEDNIRAVLTAKKYGINVTTVFIFGFPTETQEDRLAAIRLSRKLPIDSARFNIAVPYPGTELFDIAKENNRLNIKGKYENFSVQYYLEDDDLPYGLPKEEKKKVIFDVFWANLTFYLRPAVFFRNFLSGNFAGHAISIETKRPLLLFKNGTILLFLFAKRFMVIFARNFFS